MQESTKTERRRRKTLLNSIEFNTPMNFPQKTLRNSTRMHLTFSQFNHRKRKTVVDKIHLKGRRKQFKMKEGEEEKESKIRSKEKSKRFQ